MQIEYEGRNSISNLDDIDCGKTLIFVQSRMQKRFEQIFNRYFSKNNIIYSQISPNPKFEEISLALDSVDISDGFKTIIAFGGGSVIDFAKAYKFYAKSYLPLIAIPTTAGTGSECTQFAVVYKNGVKTSLDESSILPNICIVDPQFLDVCPQYTKACCAMDTYCQAIESYWARKATTQSKKYAIQAISICSKYLVNAVNSNDDKALDKMMEASHLAGKAINISRTTASHALSYGISQMFDIPHGHAVALTIANLFEFNLKAIDNLDLLLSTIGIKKSEVKIYFKNLMNVINLDCKVIPHHQDVLENLVKTVNIDRLNNNIVPLCSNDIFSLFKV